MKDQVYDVAVLNPRDIAVLGKAFANRLYELETELWNIKHEWSRVSSELGEAHHLLLQLHSALFGTASCPSDAPTNKDLRDQIIERTKKVMRDVVHLESNFKAAKEKNDARELHLRDIVGQCKKCEEDYVHKTADLMKADEEVARLKQLLEGERAGLKALAEELKGLKATRPEVDLGQLAETLYQQYTGRMNDSASFRALAEQLLSLAGCAFRG